MRYISLLLCLAILAAACLPGAAALAEGGAVLRLPAAIREIEAEAFCALSGIEQVELPEGLETIASRAFAGSDIAQIVLPESLELIADNAFEDCDGLQLIVYAGSKAHAWCEGQSVEYFVIDPLVGGGCEIVSGAGMAGTLTIPSMLAGCNVVSIGASAFEDNIAITALVLPETLKSIGSRAFAGCTGLAGTVKIPDSVIDMASDAFVDCPANILWAQNAISFSNYTVDASSTRAYMFVSAKADQSGKFTDSGLRVWDADGRLVVSCDKTGSSTASSKTVWFDVWSDAEVRLEPDSAYTCRMYVVYNGYTCWTEVKSFSTGSASKINASLGTGAILSNLEACRDTSILPSGKKEAMITIARELLSDGYTPAFTAGVVANVRYEGSFGKFESSAYSSNKPTYLAYMDDLYDYRSKYSGKLIYNGISLSELSALMEKLAADSYTRGKFGLGSVQWTGGRTKALVALYMAEAAGSDTITLEQTIAAEMKMIRNELSGGYKSVHTNWKKNNSEDLYSDDAAFNAGYRVCVHYEVPASYRQKGITRGAAALRLYEVMMGL